MAKRKKVAKKAKVTAPKKRKAIAIKVAPDPKPVQLVDAAPAAEKNPEWVSSQEQLGKVFKCHSHSFPRWRKQHEDAPRPRQNGDHSVPAWQDFFKRHPEIELELFAEQKYSLENRVLEAKAETLELKLARERGESMDIAEMEAWLADKIDQQRQILRGAGRQFLPQLDGLAIPQMVERWEKFLEVVQKPLQALGLQLKKIREDGQALTADPKQNVGGKT